MIQETFSKLGFSQKETSVYLLLLQHGKLTASQIAQKTGINRPTIYSVAKELVRKGLLFEDLSETTLHFAPRPPQDLIILVNREERQLYERKRLVERAEEELKTYTLNSNYSIPSIVFIPHEEVESYLRKRTLAWNEAIMKHDGIFWGFQDNSFTEQYTEWIDWYWQQAPKQLKLQLFSNASKLEDSFVQNPKFARRIIRYWKGDQEFSTSTWVVGDSIITLATRGEKHHLVEVEDADMAKNTRFIYQKLWAFTETGKGQASTSST